MRDAPRSRRAGGHPPINFRVSCCAGRRRRELNSQALLQVVRFRGGCRRQSAGFSMSSLAEDGRVELHPLRGASASNRAATRSRSSSSVRKTAPMAAGSRRSRGPGTGARRTPRPCKALGWWRECFVRLAAGGQRVRQKQKLAEEKGVEPLCVVTSPGLTDAPITLSPRFGCLRDRPGPPGFVLRMKLPGPPAQISSCWRDRLTSRARRTSSWCR